jgi:hypothetical protein
MIWKKPIKLVGHPALWGLFRKKLFKNYFKSSAVKSFFGKGN